MRPLVMTGEYSVQNGFTEAKEHSDQTILQASRILSAIVPLKMHFELTLL